MKHKTNISVRNNKGVYVIPNMILGIDGIHTSGDVFDANAIDEIASEIRDRKYNPDNYSGCGRVYLKKNMRAVGLHFDRFVDSVPCIEAQSLNDAPDEIVYDKQKDRFVGIKNGKPNKYYINWLSENSESYIHPDREYNYVCDIDETSYYWENGALVEDIGYKKINLLTQEMINKPNTIYYIGYDYELNDKNIVIPQNCILVFSGGSLNNGTITLNETFVYSDYSILENGENLKIYGAPQIGTYRYDNTLKQPTWWNGVAWVGPNGKQPAPAPEMSGIIYYGFAPKQLVGVNGLNFIEKSSVAGTYIAFNAVEGYQYFMIIPNHMIIENVMDTMNFPMALQGIVEIGGVEYNRYISAGSEFGYKVGEYEFHCNVQTDD